MELSVGGSGDSRCGGEGRDSVVHNRIFHSNFLPRSLLLPLFEELCGDVLER